MKTLVPFLALIMSCNAGPLLAQASLQAVSASTDESELLSLDQTWADAAIRNDAETISRLLADDFVGVNSQGEVIRKSNVLAAIADEAVKCDVNKGFDYIVKVYGNTGIIVHNTSFRGSAYGQDTSGEYRSTHVVVRREGKWVVVESHTTRVGGRPVSSVRAINNAGGRSTTSR
jgi:ketosteroid isomerase-like protein